MDESHEKPSPSTPQFNHFESMQQVQIPVRKLVRRHLKGIFRFFIIIQNDSFVSKRSEDIFVLVFYSFERFALALDPVLYCTVVRTDGNQLVILQSTVDL